MATSRYHVPWARFIRGDCAFTPQAPCLVHFDDLHWRDRDQALIRAGVQPSTGR
jgi:hypothetical protein